MHKIHHDMAARAYQICGEIGCRCGMQKGSGLDGAAYLKFRRSKQASYRVWPSGRADEKPFLAVRGENSTRPNWLQKRVLQNAARGFNPFRWKSGGPQNFRKVFSGGEPGRCAEVDVAAK